ncbi:RES domain-containing protein [Halomonas campaniensis]|uniref:RES domain-containing protein n=1 Tax=Halomonas campaniensis TaxID=213554 RepID=UPI001482A204|nr:RES domain-containing protein [Halomonas campaniensis]
MKCISDSALLTKIHQEENVTRCTYCLTRRVHCIDTTKLAEKLEIFFYGLVEDAGGKKFSEILDYYGVFEQSLEKVEHIVQDAFGEEILDKTFSFNFELDGFKVQWADFKEEIKHGNRFFPRGIIYSSLFSSSKANVDAAVFFQLLEQLKTQVYPQDAFYRARISDSMIDLSKMGCPPKEIATGGRANPVGIPYLYLSDNIETCIAEVRPSNTSKVVVAKFSPIKELVVLDLTSPRKLCSASSFEEEQLSIVLNYLNLLEQLSLDLSRPVSKESSQLEYIPTQFLCEFIKSVPDFSGLMFKSSFSVGNNYVFFNDGDLQAHDACQHEVYETRHRTRLV